MDNVKTLTDGTQVKFDNKILYVGSGKFIIPISDVPGLVEYLHSEMLKNKPNDFHNRPFEARSLLKEWTENVWKMKQYSTISDSDAGIFVKFENIGAADSACKFFKDKGWQTLSDGRRVHIYQDNLR